MRILQPVCQITGTMEKALHIAKNVEAKNAITQLKILLNSLGLKESMEPPYKIEVKEYPVSTKFTLKDATENEFIGITTYG